MNGTGMIVAERQRQIEEEGWTWDHDDEHTNGEMALAAACYALAELHRQKEMYGEPPPEWPWDREWWKPTPMDRIRELVKAGALIAAEIDRLKRVIDETTCPNCGGAGEDEVGNACQVCG